MFTYIKLENFKSFKSVAADFTKKKGEAKKIIALYGENGSGKSNFVAAYEFLVHSFTTLESARMVMENLKKQSDEVQLTLYEKFEATSRRLFKENISDRAKEIRTIGESGDVILEYGFSLFGKEGYYKLVIGEELKSEELYFVTGLKRGFLYKIKKVEGSEYDIFCSPYFISNNQYKNELTDDIKKYWGKHTLMSIIRNDMQIKNEEYIESVLHPDFIKLLDELFSISVTCNKNYNTEVGRVSSELSLGNLEGGTIPIEEKDKLNRHEVILNLFFTQLYSDIKSVYYQTKINKSDKGFLDYELYLKKYIGGKLIDIDFNMESTGTVKLLRYFPFLIACLCGGTVIMDEVDSGIHDLLMNKIIEALKDEMSGQLIMTTHSTVLLESLNADNAYVITVDEKGNKDINCIADYKMRMQKNNNLRDKYLKGEFYGIPYGYLDISELKSHIDSCCEVMLNEEN